MRSKRTSPEEQLRLINECHQSGLTDYEWCQQHNIKVSTFYAWVHRLKRSGEIDIPAVIPTVVRKEPEQPDIVKIKIEGEKRIATTPKSVLTPEQPAETLPSMQTQPGYPVMEVIIRISRPVSEALFAENSRRGPRRQITIPILNPDSD